MKLKTICEMFLYNKTLELYRVHGTVYLRKLLMEIAKFLKWILRRMSLIALYLHQQFLLSRILAA